jgi:hypothetical protein
MNEAKFSICLRFNLWGYDSQLTLRNDTDCQGLISNSVAALKQLEQLGAVPERRWENNKAPAATKNTEPGHNGIPECPEHHLSRLGKRGYYCPARKEDGEYCTWEAPAPKGGK